MIRIGYSPDTGEFLVQRIDNTLRPSGIPWIVKDGMVVGRSDKINAEIRFAASDDIPNAKIMTKNDVVPRHSGFADIANISHENRLNVTHAKNPNGGTDIFVNGKLLTQNNTGLKFICGFIISALYAKGVKWNIQ